VGLSDFGPNEAAPLAADLPVPDQDRDPAMARVFHWTDGHPFLTQCLCATLASNHGASDREREGPEPRIEPWIDRTAYTLFFDEQAAKDNNLDFVKNMLTRHIPRGVRPEEIPLTYQRVLQGRPRSRTKNAVRSRITSS